MREFDFQIKKNKCIFFVFICIYIVWVWKHLSRMSSTILWLNKVKMKWSFPFFKSLVVIQHTAHDVSWSHRLPCDWRLSRTSVNIPFGIEVYTSISSEKRFGYSYLFFGLFVCLLLLVQLLKNKIRRLNRMLQIICFYLQLQKMGLLLVIKKCLSWPLDIRLKCSYFLYVYPKNRHVISVKV